MSKYNMATAKKIIENNVKTLRPLYEGLKFVDMVVGKGSAAQVKKFLRENAHSPKKVYDYLYECGEGTKYGKLAEYMGFPDEEELLGERVVRGSHTFDTLQDIVDTLNAELGANNLALVDNSQLNEILYLNLPDGGSTNLSMMVFDVSTRDKKRLSVSIHDVPSHSTFMMTYHLDTPATADIVGEDSMNEDQSAWQSNETGVKEFDVVIGRTDGTFMKNGQTITGTDIQDAVRRGGGAIDGVYEMGRANVEDMDKNAIYVVDKADGTKYKFHKVMGKNFGIENMEVVAEPVKETEPVMEERAPRHWAYLEEDGNYQVAKFDESYDDEMIRETIESIKDKNPMAFLDEDSMHGYIQSQR